MNLCYVVVVGASAHGPFTDLASARQWAEDRNIDWNCIYKLLPVAEE